MKQITLLLFALLAFHCSAQYGIHFQDITLQQALNESGSVNKPVFFMGYASWCAHCNKMKETVFTQDSVAGFFDAHFICMMMDMEKGDGISLKKKFNISSFPTFVFIDSTGQTLYQVVGELTASNLIKEGKNAITPEKQIPYLRQQFESNVSDTDKCLQYLLALNRARLPTMKVTHLYFSSQNNHPSFTVMNWRILNAGVSDIQSPEFQYIIEHQKEFGAVMTPVKVERKIFRTAAYNLQPLANNNDTLLFFQERNLVSNLKIRMLDSLIFNLDLMVYENNNNWTSYQLIALKHTKDFEWDDYSQLQHIASQFFKQISDVNVCRQAATWAERSSQLKPEYLNTLLHAQLLEKSGDEAGAKDAAQHAKQIASITHSPTTEADQLLQRIGN